MPRARRRLARLLQLLVEPSRPRRPAKVRINPRHPRPTAKTTARAAERARARRDQAEIERLRAQLAERDQRDAVEEPVPARRHEGRAVHWWTAIGTVLAGLVAVPALIISLNALKVSEQQAEQAAQQFANRVTAPPMSFVRPGFEEDIATLQGSVDDDGMMLFHVRLRNTNSVPVVVEGVLYESADGGEPFLEADCLSLNLPPCTEGTFEMLGSERKLGYGGVRLYTKNALDGRHWTVPEPGQQARPVETAVDASKSNRPYQAHWRPKPSKVISPCA